MENKKNINRIPIKITERTLNNNNQNKEIIYIDKTNNNNNLKINQGEEVKKIETSFKENSFSENNNINKIKTGPHIVKIRVNPSLSPQSSSSSASSTTTRNDDDKRYKAEEPVRSCISSSPLLEEIRTTLPSTNNSDFHQSASNTVRINIGETSNQVQSNMVPTPTPTPLPPNNTTTFYYYNHQNDHEESSSQNDSGTCSDLDSGKGSPITIKNKRNTSIKIINNDNPSLKMSSKLINNDCNISLISDEDEVSCDSLNSSNEEYENHIQNNKNTTKIVDFTTKQHQKFNNNIKSGPIIEERTYEDRINTKKNSEEKSEDTLNENNNNYDSYYKFHLNENHFNENGFLINGECSVKSECSVKNQEDDSDHFAGCKSYQDGAIETSTIKSSKGTIRGVKNRVRAGIATFLQIHSTKTWQEKEAGKVVVYTTTMGVVRETYQRCLKVRQILRTHLVKFDEKDVFMSRETQTEIKERMSTDNVVLPQVFVEGQHIGDAETIDRLNESGELRRILKPYKNPYACLTCEVCGGYRLLPCSFCNGSKKSVHRNHFTTELVALKCMHCDEVGLVKCYAC